MKEEGAENGNIKMISELRCMKKRTSWKPKPKGEKWTTMYGKRSSSNP
jgi:hypothetical protein